MRLITGNVALCIGLGWTVAALGSDFEVVTPERGTPNVQRIGPPTYYALDKARYHEFQQRPPDRRYPIPQQKITRETYYKWLEDSGHIDYVKNADRHGIYGPRHLTPVLAAFVKTGERRYGEACITMLRAYHESLKQAVTKDGWHSMYMDEPGYIGLYRRYLAKGGLLDPERDEWFREFILFTNRNIHVWGTPQTYWRGPMHRAQGEGVMKGLAARWYPDAPEARTWQRYADAVYQDWWQYKDHPTNDTGYYFGILMPLFLRAELVGDEEFFSHRDVKPVWERMMYEVSPDGIILPYGAHGGWNSTAGARTMMLEMIAAHTRDGRYRYAAHKLMNYLLYQQEAYKGHHMLLGPASTEKLAVAYLLADDSIEPVQPDAGSRILYRKETLRIRGKVPASRWLKDLDPAADKANICCGLIVTDKTMPAKLVLRSGWNPGDLFALVDLFPRHDPLNVPGILGITRHGVGLTSTVPAKGFSDENRLVIEDLSGTAPLRWNTDTELADSYYQTVTIPRFHDGKRATFATIVVTDYQGYPVKAIRQIAFIKNRFIVVRDIAEFEEGFLAEIGPVFNSENIGPQIGPHWTNTFIKSPKYLNYPLKNPPYDLLVYFVPQPGCTMQVVDRTAADPRTSYVPGQVRYQWRGVTQPGQKLVFTQLFYPHEPHAILHASTAAGGDRTADLIGTAGADAITVARDTVETTVLRCEFDEDRVEWIVFNPDGQRIEANAVVTDARFAYVDIVDDKTVGVEAEGGSLLTVDGDQVIK